MIRLNLSLLIASVGILFLGANSPQIRAAELRGRILDAETGRPIPARIYVQRGDEHFTVESVDGIAVPYRKVRDDSIEVHTSLSGHPFRMDAKPGKLTITVERGKEYHPYRKTVMLTEQGLDVEIQLRRWIRMSEHGWYSGETHIHRSLEELPTAMLAEELNVALPLTHWVTRSHTPPTRGDRNLDAKAKPTLTQVAPDHVIYPMNTEYEIFTVGPRRHTLGAIFALNHQQPLQMGAPPVEPIADEVRRQGGLLELDKHNWPWSMMLPPIMKVHLYELTNNHIWRTKFKYRDFGEAAAPYMKAEQDDRGGVTENGWIQFTLENYYALLNCGLAMKPTAGCASGVHPVPLGFGRVYVHQPNGFNYDDWMKGLGDGRSFVTTGPMMDIRFMGYTSDHQVATDRPQVVAISGWLSSRDAFTRIEILQNGQVIKQLDAQAERTERGADRVRLDHKITVDKTSWLAVRCYSQTDQGRPRFAHSAPFHVTLKGSRLHPTPDQAAYLIERVQNEIKRNEGVLSKAELDEYRRALRFYQQASSD